MRRRPAGRHPVAGHPGGKPTRKVPGSGARTVPTEVTEAKARAMARRLPVTRLADLTPLDEIGLPVYCAVTPLARDLTTHLGKGTTRQAARVSALMEACERVTAETPPPGTLRASFHELLAGGRRAIDPSRFDLPTDTLFAPECAVDWSPAVDLATGDQVWLATDLVICPPRDGILSQADTNGLAAGNSRFEAILHGLCEVIERDAAARALFAELYAEPGDPLLPPRCIDPATAGEANRAAIAAMRTQGYEVAVHDLTTEIPIAVLRAVLVDPAYPSEAGAVPRRFAGLGCAPDAGLALSRALTEAAQSRLAFVQGARDSFNLLPERGRTAPGDPGDGPGCDLASVPTFESEDIVDDLEYVLGALHGAGFPDVFVAAFAEDPVGFAVVRVRVPGLSSFFVDASRVGWRDLSILL